MKQNFLNLWNYTAFNKKHFSIYFLQINSCVFIWHQPFFQVITRSGLHCSLCLSAHRQIKCVGLWPFVSKQKLGATWETIIFSVEIVEGKERGSGPGDGDLLLGGLHLPCDMYSGLRAQIEIHFLASTLTPSPVARSHYCCTPTKGQRSKEPPHLPSIKPFVRFIGRYGCYSNSASLWSHFSSPHFPPVSHPSLPTFPSKS